MSILSGATRGPCRRHTIANNVVLDQIEVYQLFCSCLRLFVGICDFGNAANITYTGDLPYFKCFSLETI